MYSWAHTVERLERVYDRVLHTPPRTSAARFARHAAHGGPIAGKIMCIVIAVQMVLLVVLEWVQPAARIARAPSLAT